MIASDWTLHRSQVCQRVLLLFRSWDRKGKGAEIWAEVWCNFAEKMIGMGSKARNPWVSQWLSPLLSFKLSSQSPVLRTPHGERDHCCWHSIASAHSSTVQLAYYYVLPLPNTTQWLASRTQHNKVCLDYCIADNNKNYWDPPTHRNFGHVLGYWATSQSCDQPTHTSVSTSCSSPATRDPHASQSFRLFLPYAIRRPFSH
jgi:hypothetical protein